jgi:hypothetical protein
MAKAGDYQPIEINAFFRSHTHLPLWEILDKAGFWKQVGIKVNFEYCDSSSEAEAALFSGKIDLISGNHISPYALVAQGKPIVALASPTNGVTDRLVSREPISSLAQIRGKRVIDTTILDNGGGYNHIRVTICFTYWRLGWSLGTYAGSRSPTRCRASFVPRSTKR